MRTPSDRNESPMRSIPRYPARTGPHSAASANLKAINGAGKVSASISTIIVEAASHFPNTIWISFMGKVNRSSIVPYFFSSAMSRIDMGGITMRKIIELLPNTGLNTPTMRSILCV